MRCIEFENKRSHICFNIGQLSPAAAALQYGGKSTSKSTSNLFVQLVLLASCRKVILRLGVSVAEEESPQSRPVSFPRRYEITPTVPELCFFRAPIKTGTGTELPANRKRSQRYEHAQYAIRRVPEPWARGWVVAPTERVCSQKHAETHN